jgi:hypothetical protein
VLRLGRAGHHERGGEKEEFVHAAVIAPHLVARNRRR